MDKTNEDLSWRATVDENGILIIPDELIEKLGWKDADELEWLDQGDGSFLLVKINDPNGSTEASNDARHD